MAKKNRGRSGSASEGPATDARNDPVIDPTENVKALSQAANQRQDDLREMESSHLRELMAVRSGYEDKLREKESERIDAIRAVDVQAVQRAAEVSATAVQALAAQVPITADAVRTSLAQALDPIQRDVIALRQAQYEQQGQRAAAGETKDDRRSSSSQMWVMVGIAVAIVFGGLSTLIALASLVVVIARG